MMGARDNKPFVYVLLQGMMPRNHDLFLNIIREVKLFDPMTVTEIYQHFRFLRRPARKAPVPIPSTTTA